MDKYTDDFELAKFHDEAMIKAEHIAITAALSTSLDPSPYISLIIPDVFGKKWAESIYDRKDMLWAEYDEDLFPAITLLAMRIYVYSCHLHATYIAELNANGKEKRLIDGHDIGVADGYAEYRGMANTFSDGISAAVKNNKLLEDLPFSNFPPDWALCEAIGLVWFEDAARLKNKSLKNALDILFESTEALGNSHGDLMWSQAKNSTMEPIVEKRRRATDARHQENRKMKDSARNWYREFGFRLKNDDAAVEIIRREPIKLSTAIDWVKDFRKEKGFSE